MTEKNGCRKSIAVILTLLFVSSSAFSMVGNVMGDGIKNDESIIIDKSDSSFGLYSVDDPTKIGYSGDYTKWLSKNNPGIEIIDRRTPVARHFQNPNGSYTAYLTITPTSYKSNNDKWHDLDSGILPTPLDTTSLYSTYYGYTKEVDSDALNPFKYGYSTYNNYVLVGGDYDGWPWYDYYRGFIQWDTTSIPTVESIDYVGMRIYISNANDAAFDIDASNMEFYQMSYKPSTTSSGRTLFDDAKDGSLYDTHFVVTNDLWEPTGTTYFNLGSLSRTHLENQLSSDWFAVGFHESTEQEGSPVGIDRGVRIYVTSTSAILKVDYTTNDPPNQPIQYTPSDGATVTTLTPFFDWNSFSDPDGGDVQIAFQIRVWEDTGPNTVGTTLVLDQTYSFSTSSRTPNSGEYQNGGLVSGKNYHWHVRVQDNHGLWSEWGGTPSPGSHWDFFVNTNNEPSASHVSGRQSNLYPTKSYDIVVDYTDPDGQSDLTGMGLALCRDGRNAPSGVSSPQDIMLFHDGGTDWQSLYYPISWNSPSHESITNGWRVHWKFSIPWDWEDNLNINYCLNVADVQDGWVAWTSDGYGADFENDLQIYTMNVDDSTPNPGQSITFSGKVTFEGTTSTFAPDANYWVMLKEGAQPTYLTNDGDDTTNGVSGDWSITLNAPIVSGTYTYYARVRNDGKSPDVDDGFKTLIITVDSSPTAAFSAYETDDSSGTIESLETIRFDASASDDPNLYDLEYKWNFGDGSQTEFSDKFEEVYHVFWKPGTYDVTLKVRNPLLEEDQIIQSHSVYSLPNGDPGLSPSEETTLRNLAKEFSPVLMVNPAAWHNCPGPVSQIINNARLKQEIDWGTDIPISENPSIGDLMAFSGNGANLGYYLEEKNNDDKGDDPTTYVHFKKEYGIYYIQYWFFYYYNNGTNNHEGDWELIQLSLDSSYKPLKLTYSQHTDAFETFDFGEKRNWKNVEKYIESNVLTNHPVVYVSSGTSWPDDDNSHANYFYLGDGPWSDNTDECTKVIQFTNSDIIFLPNLDEPITVYGWLQFGGNWGDLGAFESTSGPPGPAFRTFNGPKMWTHPYEFENGRPWDGYNHDPFPINTLKISTDFTLNSASVMQGDIITLGATLSELNDGNLEGKDIEFFINNQYKGMGTTNAVGYAFYNYNTAGDPLGSYLITAVFKEQKWDYAWCDENATLYIVGPPETTVTNPSGWYNGDIVLQATATESDPYASITKVEFWYKLDTGSWIFIDNDSTSPYGITWDTGAITNSVVWIKSVVHNSKGNWGDDVCDSSFGVDNSPPDPPIVTENNCGGSNSGWPAWSPNDNPNFTWPTPNDSGSGIDHYEVQINGGGPWTTVSSPWEQVRPNGEYTFDFRSIDGVGLPSSEYRIYVRIDDSSPLGWTNFLPSDTVSSQQPDCSIQVRDDWSGLDTNSAQYQFSTNGGGSWSGWLSATCSGSPGTTSFQTITATNVPFNQDSPDQNKIQFRVYDEAGNYADSTIRNVVIDSTVPGNWESFTPSDWVLTQTQTCTIQVQDLTTGLDVDSAEYQYYDGVAWSGWISAPCTGIDGSNVLETITASNVPFNQDSETQNLIQFRIMNLAVKTGTSSSRIVKIDTTIPGDWSSFVPSTWVISNQTPTASIQVRDLTSGLDVSSALYEYSTDGGFNWNLGSVIDCTGATGTTAYQTIIAHDIPYNQDSGTLNLIRFTITDCVGHTSTSGLYIVKIDTVAPSTIIYLVNGTLGVNNPWYQSNVSFLLNATELTSGLDYTHYEVDGGGEIPFDGSTINITGEGFHNITFYSVDNATNMESNITVPIFIDYSLPYNLSISINNGDNYTNSRLVNLQLSAQDDLSGIWEMCFSEDNINWSNWTAYQSSYWYQITSMDGDVDIYYKVRDYAGNEAILISSNITLDCPPYTSAIITGTEGENGWYTSEVNIELNPHDNATSVSITNYRIDGGNWTNYSGEFHISEDGLHTIEFYSIDDQGNKEENIIITIKIDSELPETQYTFSNDYEYQEWYNCGIKITLSAIDNTSNLNGSWYRINGGNWTVYSNSIQIPFSDEGEYILEFYSKDLAGSSEEIQTLNFGLDKTAPTSTGTISPALPDGNNSWYISTVSFTLFGNDGQGSGIYNNWYRENNGTWIRYYEVLTFTNDKTYFIQFYSKDKAGNQGAIGSIIFAIDKTGPVIDITYPEEDFTTNQTSIEITWDCSDSQSGFSHYEIQINGGDWIDIGSNTSYLATLIFGENTIKIRAHDQAGNFEEYERIINVVAPDDEINDEPSGLQWWWILILIIVTMLILIGTKRRKEDLDEESTGELDEKVLPPPPPLVIKAWTPKMKGKQLKVAEKQLLEYKRKLNRGYKSGKLTKEQCKSRLKKRKVELGLRPPEHNIQ